jgi:hypothetical protein
MIEAEAALPFSAQFAAFIERHQSLRRRQAAQRSSRIAEEVSSYGLLGKERMDWDR